MLIKMITNSNNQDSSGLFTKILLSSCRIVQKEILLIIGFFKPAALNYYFQKGYGSKTVLMLPGNSNSTSRCDRPNLINHDRDMHLFSVCTGLRSLLYNVA